MNQCRPDSEQPKHSVMGILSCMWCDMSGCAVCRRSCAGNSRRSLWSLSVFPRDLCASALLARVWT
eukprot:3524200-Lingulodinium_polyedra.AAC.1